MAARFTEPVLYGAEQIYAPGNYGAGNSIQSSKTSSVVDPWGSYIGGGPNGTFGSFSTTAAAPYVAPAAVDKTNYYELKLKNLLDNPDSIKNTGAYKFQFDQGKQALERSAAAKGMTGSGNTLADLMKYGQGMASTAYDKEADRLGNLTGQQNQYILGQQSNNNTAAANQNSYNLGTAKLAGDNSMNQLAWLKTIGAPGSVQRTTNNFLSHYNYGNGTTADGSPSYW